MSANNHIVILNSKDGFRVTHCQALSNIFWWRIKNAPAYQVEQKNEINPFVLYQYFKDAKYFKTKEEALIYAEELYFHIGYVEYGICEVIYNNDFPISCLSCCENPAIVSVDGQEQCYNCGEYL